MVSAIMLREACSAACNKELARCVNSAGVSFFGVIFINLTYWRSGAIQRKLHAVRFEQLNLDLIGRQNPQQMQGRAVRRR